jgi:argininosuccinate synthase
VIRKHWYVSRPAFQTQITKLREYIDKIEDKDSGQVTYQGRRGAMVVDAVTSRQRQYNTRVLKIVIVGLQQSRKAASKNLLHTQWIRNYLDLGMESPRA